MTARAPKPCILTVLSWEGDGPLPGQYVKAPRGRTAYLIVEVRRPGPRAKHVARLVCERENPSRLRPDDVVHPWRWAGR